MCLLFSGKAIANAQEKQNFRLYRLLRTDVVTGTVSITSLSLNKTMNLASCTTW